MTPSHLTTALLIERRAEAEKCVGVLDAHPPLVWYFDLDDAYRDLVEKARAVVDYEADHKGEASWDAMKAGHRIDALRAALPKDA